ncbi:MAG: universal stress protein [Gemmataceae bacterium]|nr:universal stress protein [Gemmataceae bacterium]
MHRFQNLLVGLANRDADVGLIRYAAAVVRLGTVRAAHFIHVLDGHGSEARGAALEQAEGRVRAHFQGTDAQVSCAILEGPLEDRLLSCALERKSDLMLVGHGQGRTGRKSLARRLAMKAPCSIWLVPDGSPAVMRRVLVPVDFSEPSADALSIAAELLRLQGAGELLTLHVYFNDTITSFAEYTEVLRGREELLLRKFDDRLGGLDVPIRPLVEQGANVAQVVTRTAENHGVDLLVLSTRGRSRSASVLLGSVTEDVIVDTRHPLLVVKHFGAKLGLLQALLHVSEHGPMLHYN